MRKRDKRRPHTMHTHATPENGYCVRAKPTNGGVRRDVTYAAKVHYDALAFLPFLVPSLMIS